MNLFSIISLFLLFNNSNAQQRCKSDYICRYSKYCSDDMSCFCSKGICKYGPPPYKYNAEKIRLRGTYKLQ